MTLLKCGKKNRCTVLRNIIDIIKMIEARARVIERAGCIFIRSGQTANYSSCQKIYLRVVNVHQ